MGESRSLRRRRWSLLLVGETRRSFMANFIASAVDADPLIRIERNNERVPVYLPANPFDISFLTWCSVWTKPHYPTILPARSPLLRPIQHPDCLPVCAEGSIDLRCRPKELVLDDIGLRHEGCLFGAPADRRFRLFSRSVRGRSGHLRFGVKSKRSCISIPKLSLRRSSVSGSGQAPYSS